MAKNSAADDNVRLYPPGIPVRVINEVTEYPPQNAGNEDIVARLKRIEAKLPSPAFDAVMEELRLIHQDIAKLMECVMPKEGR